MRWRVATVSDAEALNRFLRPREYRSISLSSRLLKRSAFAIPSQSSATLYLGYSSPFPDQSPADPQAVLLRTGGGLLLPLFHEELDCTAEALEELKPHLQRGGKIYCILGMEREVLQCGAVQPHSISGRRRYYLMRRSSALALPEPPAIAALRIRRLSRHGAARVFPLEEAYQREEVLTHPERFSPTAHYLHFTRSIRHNRIYFAELQGAPVAKAGTNAIGLDYSQVGGVFTAPEYRGMGISRALMHRLLGWIHGRGQSAALFVDTDNQPACRLYTGLGFRNEGRYMILYTKLD